MKDLWIHALLFLLVSGAFVVIASFYSEAEDGPALGSVARRLAYFLVGCLILVGLMLLAEHTVASVAS